MMTSAPRTRPIAPMAASLAILLTAAVAHAQLPSLLGGNQKEALKVNEHIYQATGFGNTFMVVTDEGNVIIDTSISFLAPRHHKLLRAVSDAPIHAIILTHGHEDHIGGVALWRGENTRVIAQEEFTEFRDYHERLGGFFAARNAAQFGGGALAGAGRNFNHASDDVEPTDLFEHEFEFKLGGLTFQILHTPGETYDHLSVWIPELKAAFVGDNFYDSFPNIYTLRGTKPRWALDYIHSIDRILALKPELVLGSHTQPVRGNDEVVRRLTRYRDAIRYVHDETVLGMNEGKDVHTLMREIRLPDELNIGEGYGKISWSVRGIYEGYAGWFDGNPATMYDTPPSAVLPDLVGLAGGAGAVAKLARTRLGEGRTIEALHLADAALAADPASAPAREVRTDALKELKKHSGNFNETGWLDHGLRGMK